VAVVAATLNVREGPGTGYASLGTLGQGDTAKVLGQTGDCAWLQVETVDGLVGWIAGGGEYVDLRVACDTLPQGTFRPLTGVIVPNTRGGGQGELAVDNGTDSDSVVILTFDEAPVASAYVRAGESVTLQGIQDGTYHLYFSKGAGWNGETFTQAASYQRFEDAFEFTTTSTQTTMWEVTLYGAEGGTASTEPLDPNQFPSLGQ